MRGLGVERRHSPGLHPSGVTTRSLPPGRLPTLKARSAYDRKSNEASKGRQQRCEASLKRTHGVTPWASYQPLMTDRAIRRCPLLKRITPQPTHSGDGTVGCTTRSPTAQVPTFGRRITAPTNIRARSSNGTKVPSSPVLYVVLPTKVKPCALADVQKYKPTRLQGGSQPRPSPGAGLPRPAQQGPPGLVSHTSLGLGAPRFACQRR
jgi:hypothetical protein